jgi:hypothetical protein
MFQERFSRDRVLAVHALDAPASIYTKHAIILKGALPRVAVRRHCGRLK